MTQQQLADLRAAFFAGRFPAALVQSLDASPPVLTYLQSTVAWLRGFDQKKLLKYVARDSGSQYDMEVATADHEPQAEMTCGDRAHGGFVDVQRFLPAWEDLVTFLLEEVRSPGKKKGAKKAGLTKQSRLALSDDGQF